SIADHIVSNVENQEFNHEYTPLDYTQQAYLDNFSFDFSATASELENSSYDIEDLRSADSKNSLSPRFYYYLENVQAAVNQKNKSSLITLLEEFQYEMQILEDQSLRILTPVFAVIDHYKYTTFSQRCGDEVLSGAADGALGGAISGAIIGFVTGGPAGAAAGAVIGGIRGAIVGVGVAGVKCEEGLEWPWE